MGIEKKHLGRDSVQGEKGLRGMKLPAPRAKEVSPERASVTATSSTAGIDRKGLQGPSDSGPRERKIEGFGDKELENKGMTGSEGRRPKSSGRAELRPDDPVLGVDGTPWSWEGTVDSLESEATEFPVFKVDTSATSYKENFKEAETQTCVPLDYEERRLSVEGCAACGSGLRENRSDASGQTNRVLCLNVVSESYYPGGESIHTQFYNLDGVGPSSTSTSGDIESEAQEPQEVFGVTTSKWNRRNVEGRGPMTRSLSPTSRVFESMSSPESPERATSEPPVREDDRGSELWEECTIESLRELVCGRRGFSALGESRPASCTNPRVGLKRPGSSYRGRAKARVTNPAQSSGPSTIFAYLVSTFKTREKVDPRLRGMKGS